MNLKTTNIHFQTDVVEMEQTMYLIGFTLYMQLVGGRRFC